MIGIHPVHRRLAEIHLQAQKLGGYAKLPYNIIVEFNQCIEANAKLVVKLDELKNMAFIAHCVGEHEWEQEICRQIDELEAKLI